MRRAVVAAALAAASPAAAQQPPAGDPPPTVRFTRDAMRLDGALDEAAWALADSVTAFTQRDPVEGAPSSERTVVRFLGTPSGLWIGVRADDREPGRVRRAQLRRDADLDSDDHVTVLLSPMGDGRTGYLFSVNANGAMWDAEITAFDDERSEWDGIWDARARLAADGWHAELHIPWQSLRYGGADEWRVNLQRVIRRRNETALWRSWGRSEGIGFLDRAGHLRGFATPPARTPATVVIGAGNAPPAPPGAPPTWLPRRAVAELRPYVTSTARFTERRYDDGIPTELRGRALLADAGIDAKLAPSPTLTLDLTANADFAQAEVDRQVVNLTRFPLFFPEQRAFFTEGMGIFEFGRPEFTQLFYSRRIGISREGVPIPLLGGARLTGRLGRQQVGLLATRTGSADASTDLVARVRRDVLSNGYVGAMATFRGAAFAEGESVTRASGAGGVDLSLPFEVADRTVLLEAALAADAGPARGDATHARVVAEYPNDDADVSVRLDRIGPAYRPALGFVREAGVVDFGGQVELTPRPSALGAIGRPLAALGVRRLVFMPLDWRHVRGIGGPLSHATYEVRPLGLELESGDELEVNLQREYDVPVEPFELFDGTEIPAGRYRWDRIEVAASTSSARPLAAEVAVSNGAYYSGRAWSLEGELRARLQPHVVASAGYERGTISLDDADGGRRRFTAQEANARVDVAATPRLGASFFAQWDNESERLALNARLRWTTSPGSDAYVVWSSAWPSDRPGGLRRVPWREPTGGALIVKYIRYLRY